MDNEEMQQEGMAGEKKQRNYRSKEERKAALDEKIRYHQECIRTLEERKAKIDTARRGRRGKGVKRIISEAKLSDEETAKALGISVKELREKLSAAAEQKVGK